MLSQIGDPVNWYRTARGHLRWLRGRGWRHMMLMFGMDIYPIGWPSLQQGQGLWKVGNDNRRGR